MRRTGFGLVFASTCGALAGTIINYILHYFYTFRSEKDHRVAFVKFWLIAEIGWGVNATMHFFKCANFQLNNNPGPTHRHSGDIFIDLCNEQEVDILNTSQLKTVPPLRPSISGLAQRLISVVIPVFNEEGVLEVCHRRLSSVLNTLEINAEIIFVDDGSTNKKTHLILEAIQKSDRRVSVLELSRNFGKEAAMSAGLDHVGGDAVIIMDADLQDPPELIPLMLSEWQNGYECVYMKRKSRRGESALKKMTAFIYYRLLNQLSPIQIPADVGDFRLLSRRAVDALKQLPERSRYMKGLFSWIGFSQKELTYDRESRVSGCAKQNYRKLLKLSIDGLTSFSTTPLKLASYVGFVTAGGAFVYGLWIATKTFLFGEVVRGYSTMMGIILFLGGVQLICVGILGEYLGRMFMETKQRPLYLIKKSPVPSNHAMTSKNENERYLIHEA